MNPKVSIWAGTAVILVALALHTCAYVVQEGSMTLHTRFGQLVSERTEPGFYFKLPWPIDEVHGFEKRYYLYQGADEQVLTLDQNSLIVNNHVVWSIDPQKLSHFWQTIKTAEAFEAPLQAGLRSARNGLFGAEKFSELFDDEGNAFIDLENELLTRLQSSLSQRYGVTIRSVGFGHMGLPDSVIESVYEKMNAERERISEAVRSSGDAEAARIVAEARSSYDQAMARVEGEVKEILGQAEAEAIESYRKLTEHRDVALELKKLESLEALLRERSTIVLDRKTPPLDLLYGEKP